MKQGTRTEGWLVRLLGAALPDYAKRILFLSSLAAHMNNVSNPDRELMEKLNELMSLSKDTGALRLPMLLHGKMWDTLDISELKQLDTPIKSLTEVPGAKLKMAQVRILAARIIRHIPKCLHYDSKEAMRNDIYRLMKHSQELS